MKSNMEKPLKRKWIAALRSGKYKQTTGQLRDDIYEDEDDLDSKVLAQNYCCLGVLCEVMKTDYVPDDGQLDGAQLAQAGLSDREQQFLISLNDGVDKPLLDFPLDEMPKPIQRMKFGKKRSFKQIANVIEKYL